MSKGRTKHRGFGGASAKTRFVARCASGLLALLSATLYEAPAKAFEGFVPYLPGLAIGVPVGVLPPSGAYFADDAYFASGQVRNGDGHGFEKITGFVDLPQLLYVPGTKIFGATYGILIITPVSSVQTHASFGNQSASGVFNPYIAPLNLSWALSPNLFVSTSFGVYLPIGSYNPNKSLNIANNFMTFEPAVGLSYLKDGWDLSLSVRSDFNTENPANNYRSGNLLSVDYTVAKTIGQWTVGVGGNTTDQFTNDSVAGYTVPASPFNGEGRRMLTSGVGPIIGYTFGKSSLQLSYQHDFVGQNYGSGENVFVRYTTSLQ